MLESKEGPDFSGLLIIHCQASLAMFLIQKGKGQDLCENQRRLAYVLVTPLVTIFSAPQVDRGQFVVTGRL